MKTNPSAKNEGQIGFFYDAGQKDSGQKYISAVANKAPVADSKPHHFAAVWDHDQGDDAGQMRLYLDGVWVADEVLPHASLANKQSNPLSVGAKGNRPSLALDELRYSQRALAPPEFLSRPSVAGLKMTKAEKRNRNSWMIKENWVGGEVPKGEQTVTIGEGITAEVENKTPPKFTGSLVLENNAKVILWEDKGHSVIPQKPAKLEMHQDSQFMIRSRYNTKFGPVELHAQAEIWGGDSTLGYGMNREFLEPITGPGKLTINGVRRNIIIFEAKNTFTGGFVAHSTFTQDFKVLVRKSGNLGKGDVEIGPNCTLILEEETEDVIEDDKTLSLEVKGVKRAPKIILNSDETVGAFFINGKDQGVGEFTSESHSKYIGGTGTLKVTGLK